MAAGRLRELLKKYGKVAIGVHCSVSAASIAGLFIAIKNNVDVESFLQKLPYGETKKTTTPQSEQGGEIPSSSDGLVIEGGEQPTTAVEEKKRNRTAELAASSGGALALAILCNKALFPIRVPITFALTPPVARFLARRRITKNSV